MTPEDDTTLDSANDEAQQNADFASGFPDKEKPADKATDKAAAKDKPAPAATPQAEATPEPPKYAQVTEAELAEFKAAVAKAAGHEAQLAKAWGTIGNMQKMLNDQRAKDAPPASPAARKFEIRKEAFAKMARDFPELAEMNREALQEALADLPGPGASDADPAKLESMLAALQTKRELAILASRHPDWREIVGAVDASTGQPPPETPFRKWLGTKAQAYQDQINGSELADEIGRAIRLFQRETSAPAKTNGTPRDSARADRIRAAVQPRGDNAGAGPSKSEQDEFESGFASR
jgi:hypothetical protein